MFEDTLRNQKGASAVAEKQQSSTPNEQDQFSREPA